MDGSVRDRWFFAVAGASMILGVGGAALGWRAWREASRGREAIAALRAEMSSLRQATPKGALPTAGADHPQLAPESPSGLDAGDFRKRHHVDDTKWTALLDLNHSWVRTIEQARRDPNVPLDDLGAQRFRKLKELLPDPATLDDYVALERDPLGDLQVAVSATRVTYQAGWLK